MKNYKNKIPSGSPRDKTKPTRRQFYRVSPDAIRALVEPFKKINAKAKKDGLPIIYTGEVIREIVADFVKRTRRGALA